MMNTTECRGIEANFLFRSESWILCLRRNKQKTKIIGVSNFDRDCFYRKSIGKYYKNRGFLLLKFLIRKNLANYLQEVPTLHYSCTI